MSSVNKHILVGNLGKDPEVNYLDGGTCVANASLATSETWKDKKTGDKMERTEWHRLVFYGKVAEIVEKYLKKGSKIYVEGKVKTRKWQDKEGRDVYTTETVVDQLVMLSASGNGNNGEARAQSQAEAYGANGGFPPAPQEDQGFPTEQPAGEGTDDLPF